MRKNSRDLKRLPPFVALTWELLRSPAYKALMHSSAKALPYFLGKVEIGYRDPQRYCKEFTFSYTEATRYSFALGTFARVIDDLIGKGFIDPVDKGGLRSDGKSYNVYQLSTRWQHYGTDAFVQKSWTEVMGRGRRKATPKMETYNCTNGNETGIKGNDFSKNEVARG